MSLLTTAAHKEIVTVALIAHREKLCVHASGRSRIVKRGFTVGHKVCAEILNAMPTIGIMHVHLSYS